MKRREELKKKAQRWKRKRRQFQMPGHRVRRNGSTFRTRRLQFSTHPCRQPNEVGDRVEVVEKMEEEVVVTCRMVALAENEAQTLSLLLRRQRAPKGAVTTLVVFELHRCHLNLPRDPPALVEAMLASKGSSPPLLYLIDDERKRP